MPSLVAHEPPLIVEPAPMGRAGGTRMLSRIDSIIAGMTIVLSFVPYVARDVGASTNVPLTSFLCWYLVVRCLHNSSILWMTFILVSGPFLATSVRLLLAPHYLSPAPYVTWVLYVVPAVGMASALLVLRRRALPILSLSIAASALIAIVQKYFFLQGTIPWLWYYKLVRTYPPVEAIVDPRFNPRVMGLFPEPSVMAGSLVMALMLMVLLAVSQGEGYSWRELLALGLGVPALMLSSSGSVVPTLVVLVLCALLPLIRVNAWLLVSAPALTLFAFRVSSGILNERTGRFNWSWIDRTSSILIGVERWMQDPVTFLFGIGRGMSTYYFQHGLMPTGSHPHYSTLLDMFTVTGRIPVENGLLFGGLMLAMLIAPFARLGARRGMERPIALGSLVVWLIVATVTISYDQAFWIYGLPGGVLGVALLTREGALALGDQVAESRDDHGGKAEHEGGPGAPQGRVRRLRCRRVRRRIVATCLAASLVVPAVMWVVTMHPRTAEPRKADAIVIIGPSTRQRTDMARRLMEEGYAKALAVSAHPADTPGVRPEPCGHPGPYPVYCFDPDPATTQGEAQAITRLAEKHGWRSIQIITFAPHIERARLLVDRCYSGEVLMLDSKESFDPWDQYLYQSGGFVKALLTPGCGV